MSCKDCCTKQHTTSVVCRLLTFFLYYCANTLLLFCRAFACELVGQLHASYTCMYGCTLSSHDYIIYSLPCICVLASSMHRHAWLDISFSLFYYLFIYAYVLTVNLCFFNSLLILYINLFNMCIYIYKNISFDVDTFFVYVSV